MTASSQVADLPFSIAPALPHIREFEPEAADAVARMWRESASAWPGGGPNGGEHATAARVRQEQHDINTLATFIAWAPDPGGGQDERAVGYCTLFEQPGDASAAYVGILSAHPEWHGKGIGRDLLRAALARTVALGYSRLDLNTWAGNLKAVPLYKKSGYFWVPNTSVRMENYLPLIFRLAPAQAFFQHADWYRDFQRDLSVQPDEEKVGKQEVYTYAWQRDGRRLRVVVDREAKGVIALETEHFSASAAVDDPRLPIGGQREARWRVATLAGSSRSTDGRPSSPAGAPPLAVSILAEGEDSVRCTLQSSVAVETVHEWTAPVTAEQPPVTLPAGRPSNRVRSTVVVDGQAIPLVVGMQVIQPVQVTFDARRLWLTPGASQRVWLTVENLLDEPMRGTLRLAGSAALSVDAPVHDLTLDARRKASFTVVVRAATPGRHTLRAQAVVQPHPATGAPPAGGGSGSNGVEPAVSAPELVTKVFEEAILCGAPGDTFVEQTEDRVWIATDRHILTAPLRPTGNWQVSFQVADRATGKRLLGHSATLGPPFVPSLFAGATWRATTAREAGSVTVTLAATPGAIPGLTFEREARLSPSGLLRVVNRVINAGSSALTLQIGAGTSVDLDVTSGTKVAAPLVSGLVVEDSAHFPDWEEPDLGRPQRYAETWMAEFGGGWVGATLWQGATEVFAGWESPNLTFDLGAVPPGGQAETPPIYLYAGQGDWKTARTLWRQLIGPAPGSPTAGAADGLAPLPAGATDGEIAVHPAHSMRLERSVFDADSAETALILTSERARTMAGQASVEVAGTQVAVGDVQGLTVGAPQSIPVRIALPRRAAALPATLVFDHPRERETEQTAVVRAGLAGTSVDVSVAGEGAGTRVQIENGRLRLVITPAVQARLVELSVRDASGAWINQLHAADPGPETFIWFNPWYGGIHPALNTGGSRGNPARLQDETFTWRTVETTGGQGVRWTGLEATTLTSGRDLAGLRLQVSYLTSGESNLVAVVQRLENRSGARAGGTLSLSTFLQPGGDRRRGILYFEREGRLRHQKRVHGGGWGSAGSWCAVVAPEGPALTLVQGSPWGSVDLRDMGLEGAHPSVSLPLDLAPDEVKETVTYLAVADDLDQSRAYRVLAGRGLV